MNKKVSITELMTETAVLTIGLTFYYWYWVRKRIGKNPTRIFKMLSQEGSYVLFS